VLAVVVAVRTTLEAREAREVQAAAGQVPHMERLMVLLEV
jgi:hypothetical protein